jgi:hypothetical protein
MYNKKVQSLLISHLQKHGSIKIFLPDEVILEIGVNQVNQNGELINADNYCWVITTKGDRMTVLDSYNLGLRFSENAKNLIFEDTFVNNEGEKVKRLDVI